MVPGDERAEDEDALGVIGKSSNVATPSDAQTDARVKKMLVTLRDDELVAEMFASKSGVAKEEAEKLIRRNRRAITKRGESVKMKEEIGQHLESLNALYTSAMQAQDLKTALSVEKEIGKTLSLYNKIEEKEASKVDAEKEEARAILQSALEGTKLERVDDLARAVVNRLVDLETRKK